MAKKGGGSPDYPDPSKTANQQAVLNEQTARTNASLNRIDQYTPYGQQRFTDLGNDRWRSDIVLSPDSEAAARAEMLNSRLAQELGTDQLGRIRGTLGEDLSFEGLPELAGSAGYADQRQGVEDALYQRATSRLDPQFEQQQRQFETGLANKGIPIGSEAWQRATDTFNRGRNDAYSTARSDAITGGGAEQSRLFGLDLGSRQQGVQERLTERNQPINELAALLSSGQVSVPQFAPAGQASSQPVDYTGLVNNRYQTQANAAQQSQQNWMNGLFGLGQAGLSAWMGS